mmetsp:Transcript_39994/g.55590  ORF Transcript_39994/g.55590 Transcript_39994/m.55590 type:complete len:157 (-) Transcript_39994:160-630(-)|eukprot:CAMPEP_0196582816 /NCGR_PEP_ID=MMETSP1081-20130531/40832_1 /TAXON_ID=36882 /ORGANISM="Pyramimonas amylifera, Strain CCMP720" /LENGTH=156 /DNA_ID=CAMNT_0041903511 /DNA_START=320 /DNA_END=790 /DNA_ORIENTATION=-
MGFETSKDEESERIQKIMEGLNIEWMNMRDATTGKVLWEQTWPSNWKTEEVQAHVPKEIMKCREVSREVVFSSKHEIHDFFMMQHVFVNDICIEEWSFKFGFVIPGSTNSWQSTIEAVEEEEMLDAQQISGLVRIETSFMEGDVLIHKSTARIFYV